MEQTTKEVFVLTRDGKEYFRGTQFECELKLQRSQSQSYDWATKYGGWRVIPVRVIKVYNKTVDVFPDGRVMVGEKLVLGWDEIKDYTYDKTINQLTDAELTGLLEGLLHYDYLDNKE